MTILLIEIHFSTFNAQNRHRSTSGFKNKSNPFRETEIQKKSKRYKRGFTELSWHPVRTSLDIHIALPQHYIAESLTVFSVSSLYTIKNIQSHYLLYLKSKIHHIYSGH